MKKIKIENTHFEILFQFDKRKLNYEIKSKT